MIHLHVEPRVVKLWEEFLSKNPACSIALDGYVRGRPRFTAEGPFVNFNHHEEVDRLGTRSTCAQVYVAIKQGLFDTFKKDGQSYAHVFVNDPDQDTSLGFWLLENNERVRGQKSEPLINRLVTIEDLLDATAGAYPLDPDSSIMQEIAWIFDPYTKARVSGRLPFMDSNEMENVMKAVGGNISNYSLGKGKKIELDTRFDDLGGGLGWKMIREVGPYARTSLFAKGVKAYVMVRDNGNGTYTYSLGRMSPFVHFPQSKFYHRLNIEEGLIEGSNNCWGGGDTTGGSPRMTGSKTAPDRLASIINDEL